MTGIKVRSSGNVFNCSEIDHTSKKTGIYVGGDDGKPFCFADRAVRRDVDNLEVQCSNSKLGCQWVGQLMKYFEIHETQCCFRPQPCPHCNELVLTDKLEKHFTTECPKRTVPCEHCTKDIAFDTLEKHYNQDCEKFLLQCEHCKRQVPRNEMDEHMLKECEFLQCTCGILLKRSAHVDDPTSVASHLKSPAVLLMHLLAICSTVKDIMKQINTMESMLIKQYMEIRQLKSQLECQRLSAAWNATSTSSSRTNSSSETQRLSHLEHKYEDMESRVTMLALGVRVSEMQQQASLCSTYNGSYMLQFPDLNQSSIQSRLSRLEQAMYSQEFVFRISDLRNQRRNAVERHKPFLDSPPFYTAKNGYKMCIRVYLNGDGMGHKTHLSLFFALMRGEFDALLKWPFDHRVSLTLVDQTRCKHIVQTFKPTPESSSFQRPISDMNVASGCPQFCKLSFLDDDNYIKDDVLFIKCIVDTSHFCSIPEHELYKS